MALQKQVIQKLFTDGLDTKTNPQLSQGPLQLENAVFNLRGRVQKRNGYTALGTAVLNATIPFPPTQAPLTAPEALGIFNNELLAFQAGKIYGESVSTDEWINKNNAFTSKITKTDIIKDTYQQTQADTNIARNISVYAWFDSRATGGLRYSVIDESTNTKLVANQEITGLFGNTSNPKVISCNQFIYIYYIDGTRIVATKIDPVNPTAVIDITNVSTIATDLNATYKFFDVENITTSSGPAMVFTYVNTAGNMTLIYVTQNLFVGNGINGYAAPVVVTQTPTQTISVHNHQNNRIFVASYDGAAGIKATIYDTSFNVLVATFVVDSSISSTPNITMSSLNSTTVRLHYTNLGPTTPLGNRVFAYDISTIGVVGTIIDLIISLALASKAFTINSRIYFVGVFTSSLQPTYFVIRDDGYICAKFSNGTAGNYPTNGMLPEFVPLTSTTGFIALGQKGPLVTEVGTAFSLIGIEKIALDFADPNQYISVQVGKNLHIIGGYLQNYDGISITEHGFHIYPEGITAVPGAAGALTGTYGYIATYEWTDAQGQLHRSATSVPISVTLAAQRATVTVPQLCLTTKQQKYGRTDVVIGIYRTKNNGTVYYRTSSIASPIYSTPSPSPITFTDNNTDAQIAGNELLYTTGGDVDNIAPPACQFVRSFNNRVIIAGLEDPTQLWFSKSYQVGYGIGFSDQFTKQVDAEGGNITALGNMDDKIIIFKASQIFFISGDGPNNTGQQDNFTLPQKISSDVGCANQKSIVTGPNGILFQSSKGIYLLDRTLNVSYVGENVDRYNSYPVQSAVLLQSVNEIRFTTTNNDTLVFNYLFNQWSNFKNHIGTDAKLWQGIYTYINSTGLIFKETPGAYLDNNNRIQLRIVTPWYSFAGIQAFARCYQIDLLGEYKGAHKLVVSLAYNFQPYFAQQITYQSNDIFQTEYYGEDAYYGASSPYGGQEAVYQYRINPSQQKIESLQLSIEDVYAGTGTQSYSLSGLSFELGTKQGVMKIPVSRAGG